MLLWLEQEKGLSEGQSVSVLRLPHIRCSTYQRRRLEEMAESRILGIWRIKRAKVILGALEGRTLERLVVVVRVPPETIVKCLEAFSERGLKSLKHPTRKPTRREARVEKMLDTLENPPKQETRDWRSLAVHYIGIDFTAPMIQEIRALIAANPEATRPELGRMICRTFGFYSPTGKARVSTITDILKRMEMDNLIRLPEVTYHRPYRKKKVPPSPLLDQRESRAYQRKDIEPLAFVPIQTPDQQHLWKDMMTRYHYLKNPKLFGPQLRYLIWGRKGRSVSERPGADHVILLGAIGFSNAAWRLASRDAFIGWDDRQRESQLNRVIGNSRFLILPWIQCPNLASMILGRIVKRVSTDWEAAYGIQPVLLETFVQSDRFAGTCYRAANWIKVGGTGGYSYFSGLKKKQVHKSIFLFPLRKDFRKELCKTL